MQVWVLMHLCGCQLAPAFPASGVAQHSLWSPGTAQSWFKHQLGPALQLPWNEAVSLTIVNRDTTLAAKYQRFEVDETLLSLRQFDLPRAIVLFTTKSSSAATSTFGHRNVSLSLPLDPLHPVSATRSNLDCVCDITL